MSQPGYRNRILRDLDGAEQAILQPHLEQVAPERGAVLAEAAQPADYLYFPETCVLTLVGVTASSGTVEVALVGPEGVASVTAALGRYRLPFRVVVQVAGLAWRAPSDVVAHELHRCRQLNERLLVYSQSVFAQVGQSAICNRFHTSRQRLARWLLMTADRADSCEIALTHEFIANMVGGPRSAVTEAAAALRSAGAIDYRRGRIIIRDAARLREQACECYGAAKDPLPK